MTTERTASTPEAIAIILARGGSRGLPRKNALPIAGRPCIAWTVDAARAAETVGTVVVSSDDDELLRIGALGGATPHHRSPGLSTDTATVDDAAREAANTHAGDPIVILYGNVPVRPEGLIDRAVRTLIETGADSVQSYCEVGKHHPWWTARVGDDGSVAPWEGDQLNHGVFRRQDLPKAHIPDGGVIAVTRAALFHEIAGVPDGPHAFFGRDRRGVITQPGEVIDIDSKIDLRVADAILTERHQSAIEAGAA
ncbi:MAG: acylneuraminate cytidylyltransferase family protein [Planctomycetota bacterium]